MRFLHRIILVYALPAIMLLPATNASEENLGKLLFHATFDQGTDASHAMGSPHGRCKGEISLVESKISGKAVRLAQHREIAWQQHKNVNLKEGTVAFWMRAVDWNPAVATPGYDWIFSIAGLGAEGDRIQIFKMPQPLLMCFVGKEGTCKQLPFTAKDLKQGVWYFMTLTWQAERTAFYVNGQQKATAKMTHLDLPQDTGTNIFLRSNCGISEYDDLRIYNRALCPGEIESLYLQSLPKDNGKLTPYRPAARIGKCTSAPRLDGRAEEQEWAASAPIGNFLVIPEMTPSPARSSVRMTYDEQAIYVHFSSRQKNRREPRPQTVSTQTLWSVPSAEILFQKEDRTEAPVYQIAFNKFGQHMTLVNGQQADWPAEVAASAQDDRWQAEIRIPFKGLGMDMPAPGTVWKANFADNLLHPQKFSNPALSMAYADVSNFWDVTFAEKAAPTAEATVEASRKQLIYHVRNMPQSTTGWKANVYIKKMPLTLTDLTGNLRLPSATPGQVIQDADVDLDRLSAIQLPTAGRYLSQVTIMNPRQETIFTQLIHFQVHDTFRISPVFFSKQKKMHVNWTMNMPVQERFKVQIQILSGKQGTVAKASQSIPAGQTSGFIPFDMHEWKELDYHIRATFVLPDRTEVRELPFKCFYHAPWHGFVSRMKLGQSVPPPWKPIRFATPDTLETLTQSYRLGTDGLPKSMKALNRQLTYEPISLTLQSGGSNFVQTTPMSWISREPHAASWQTSHESPDCKAILKGRLEYDGMIRYDLTLIPKGKQASLSSLILRIPIRREIGRNMLPYAGPYQAWDMLTVPTEFNPHYQDAFMPHLWAGNNQVGLAWFAESDEHYRPKSRKRVVELTRNRHHVMMQINMVERPLTLTGKTVYTFGLQATPSKEVPKNWTSWHLASCLSTRRKPLISMGYTTGREYHKYLGLPYPTQNDKRARESITESQKLDQTQSLIYATSNGMGSGCPEFQFFQEEWKNPLNCDTWSFASCGQYFWGTNPQASSLQDFFLWSTAQALEKFGNDGLYYDFGTVMEVFNPASGCGYSRDGVNYPTWPVFADRTMRQCLYELFMRKKGHATFVCHNYSKTVTPITSFMTMLLDGEPYQQKTGVIGAKVTSDYTELIPLSRFATMFGTQFGMIPVFLVKFPDDERPDILRRGTRTIQALAMPHGVPVWGFYCDIKELNKAVFIQDDFDLSDAVFIPYFSTSNSLSLSPAKPGKVLLSYWEKPNGNRLAVVANLSRQDYAGDVVFPAPLTGQLIQGEHGKPVPLNQARRFNVSVPAKDFRMYRIYRR